MVPKNIFFEKKKTLDNFPKNMKALVYDPPVNNTEDLVARTVIAADKINTIAGIFEKVHQSYIRRCELGNATLGHHIQHLL